MDAYEAECMEMRLENHMGEDLVCFQYGVHPSQGLLWSVNDFLTYMEIDKRFIYLTETLNWNGSV